MSLPKYHPCISLIMPFEPKMGLNRELNHRIKVATDKIERMLSDVYPNEIIESVLFRFKDLTTHLNFNTHKKSIAIYVSPLLEKVFYLDMPVEETIILDNSFEIRDLIFSKKQLHKYILAVLSSKWSKLYLGNTNHFLRIGLTKPESAEAYKNHIPEKVANFSDENKRKEILLDKFLRHTDKGIENVLKMYRLPLFVMGTTRTIGHFKSITKNSKQVIQYITGNFEEHSETGLQKIMQPHLSDWNAIIQKNILHQIDEAMNKKRLSFGMEAVWKIASEKRGRLLVVEKNYICPARQGDTPDLIYISEDMIQNYFHIKDAVDDCIEMVLNSGGDVEFVDEGILKEYEHIALIEYY